jgi:hypothetical protein
MAALAPRTDSESDAQSNGTADDPPNETLDHGHPPPQPAESFRSAIQAFVSYAESNASDEYSISRLLTKFHLQKRRMYDVTSVLTVIGCCEKMSVDSIRWVGLSRIPFALLKLQREAGAESGETTLDAIIGSCAIVSISSLTRQFVLCFLVLHLATMDIREISRYLSRKTGRRKSTLCKLYQIAHILEAASVLIRSDVPGSITLVDRFFTPVDIIAMARPAIGQSPYAIDSILNHENHNVETITARRRKEFSAEIAKKRVERHERHSNE